MWVSDTANLPIYCKQGSQQAWSMTMQKQQLASGKLLGYAGRIHKQRLKVTPQQASDVKTCPPLWRHSQECQAPAGRPAQRQH